MTTSGHKLSNALSALRLEKTVNLNLLNSSKVTGFTTDSRKVDSDYVFFAVRLKKSDFEQRFWYMYTPGESDSFFDGHPYIDHAIKMGAKVIFCEVLPQNLVINIVYIQVTDVIAAMGILAKTYVQSLNISIVGVTGSSGKTTAVHAIYTCLKECGAEVAKVYATRPTPITLAESVLNMIAVTSKHPDVLIVEMPADRSGVISTLSHITSPTVGLVLNIKPAHAKTLGGIPGIVEEKSTIVKRLNSTDFAILNADDPNVIKMADSTEAKVISFGINEGQVQGRLVNQYDTYSVYDIRYGSHSVSFRSNLLGESALYTVLATFAVAIVFGKSLYAISRAFEKFVPMEGRMSWHFLDKGRIRVFNNTAKGTPTNTDHLLDLLEKLPWKGLKILVLGDFDFQEDETTTVNIWQKICARFNVVFLSGIRAQKYPPILGKTIRVVKAHDKDEVLEKLVTLLATNEVCYVVINGNLEYKHSVLFKELVEHYV